MSKFAKLNPKTYSYLTDYNDENKKEKAQKSVMKRKLRFENYKNC